MKAQAKPSNIRQEQAFELVNDNDYFKMGAAVAVGELYDLGRLGRSPEAKRETQSFLASFGICDMDDLDALGMKGPYLNDFRQLFAQEG